MESCFKFEYVSALAPGLVPLIYFLQISLIGAAKMMSTRRTSYPKVRL